MNYFGQRQQYRWNVQTQLLQNILCAMGWGVKSV